MAGRKKVNVEEITKKVSDVAGKAAETVGEAAGAVAETVAETVKPVVKRGRKKMEPAAEAVGEAVKPVVKRARKAISEGGRKAAAALVPEVYLQWGEQEVSFAELVERAKADYKAQNKGAIRSCKLYVKPEDGMVYYVINSKAGKVAL